MGQNSPQWPGGKVNALRVFGYGEMCKLVRYINVGDTKVMTDTEQLRWKLSVGFQNTIQGYSMKRGPLLEFWVEFF